MSLTIILIIAIILSVGFHFIGIYTGAKKTIWLMLAIMWAGSINIAMSEIKPKGYEQIEKVKGQFADTDAIIVDAGEEISVYEMILIMQSYQINSPKK